ncbi:histidine phosphatase family protein [Commensalibacter oyaizuii]|uniref:Histidine phosphatase family protein n=1 Tax=Commensalibacter oyaizuii TaxID=3043873 RepID=A0ABT6Q174_9PROT|nr:histidine phosphatase family protein [Commensalibacter sp. TBRC 16381]MDI2090860.1 histidine phosphatase family protein [Commensalibacter sp. TBRC 16381]
MSSLLTRPYWYLRHGQTDWNARNLSQGRTDIPLNTVGLSQAVAAGNAIANHWEQLELPITQIVSSPLGRARRTAEITAAIIKEKVGVTIPVELDDSLKEVCFGTEEGQPMGPWYDDWIAGKFTPEGGESFQTLCARISEAVNRSIRKAGEGNVLIVAHGGIFRSLRHMMGLKANVRLPNAQPLCARPPVDGGKAWELHALPLE